MIRHIPVFLLLLVTALTPCEMAAQDDVLYRYHLLHPGLLNPAVTGSEYFPLANLTYQKQWVGIPGSPYSMVASTSIRIGNFDFYNPKKLINTTSLKSKERIGLGLILFGDNNGPTTQRGFNLSYAYHLSLNGARLSLGLSGGAEQKMVDESIFNPTYSGDPILTNRRESYILGNTNVGIYYYSPGLFAGIAAHHLIPFENSFQPGSKVKPDLVLHGGYLFSSLARPKLEVSMNFRYLDFTSLEYDLHIRSFIQQVHWVAISVRSYKALAVHVGIKISAIHLAYTYESNLSKMVHYNLGTHALSLGLNLGMRRTQGF